MEDVKADIPGLTLTITPVDKFDIKQLEGLVRLPSWSQHTFEAVPGKDNSSIPFSIGGDQLMEDPVVKPEHAYAYQFLIEHEASIRNIIQHAVLPYYRQVLEEYDDPDLPRLENIDGLKEIFRLEQIHILNYYKDGVAYTGYQFSCAWDGEHGLGLMLHKDRVVEIGGSDTSFLSWIAERDIDPEKVNAEIEANRRAAEEAFKKQQKKPWWKLW